MTQFQRRRIITGLTAAALSGAVLPAWSQTAKPAAPGKPKAANKLAAKLRIVIPANPGGGWDQTGRALGTAMISAGVIDEVEYENKGGKGGTLGLAHYAEKYNADANTLLMGGTVMVGAVALQKPAVDLSAIQPVARLTSDYLVMVVAANSPIKSVSDLTVSMKANLKGVPVAGGSAGGVDHIFAGVFARAAGANPEDLNYQPFASGVDVVSAVLSGKAAVGISGYSEFSAQLAGGQLRAIGVSSRKPSFGIPAIREQGVQAEMSNWRAVFTGKGVSAGRQTEMLEAVRLATQHDAWKTTLKQNHWDASWMAGKDLVNLIDLDLTTARVMVHLLKLKA
ncbi:MAG: twin-arginine translocation pathway signal protein [Curvibacter sp. RIFCSPHIGHO2_12_FULL_63_18]|uniref:Bug family tripartite tricarboxylate transporter substrate binding protein n=1 Tax=Rhodoferax sp. TaxID=50421 RepID=UPI0008C18A0C|nr:tripartite tricarboxylate transporter substrate-binding protein [Rhodoferax sp.]OGO95374.1 MAG: twin-arginine translocation pathway signal protein [Curvibacter sp. GWA2_63_95]OGO99325.1 MAG: twin-arginine translocation pathway signal protein [Curvibacter sp. RIFCSPHIGHO2_12_FULL_63_18]HCX81105.1 twin-arginine translocation pathway signal protein [Rhodoferax sp.]